MSLLDSISILCHLLERAKWRQSSTKALESFWEMCYLNFQLRNFHFSFCFSFLLRSLDSIIFYKCTKGLIRFFVSKRASQNGHCNSATLPQHNYLWARKILKMTFRLPNSIRELFLWGTTKGGCTLLAWPQWPLNLKLREILETVTKTSALLKTDILSEPIDDLAIKLIKCGGKESKKIVLGAFP